MKNLKANQKKSSLVNFQKFALKANQKKQVKGGNDIITEDLADV